MQRLRAISVVEDSWGCGIVFGDVTEIEQNIGSTSQQKIISPKSSLRDIDEYDVYNQSDIEDESNEIDYCFTYLQASILATVLEDTIMEMRILVQCNNQLRVAKTAVDWNQLCANKFGVRSDETKDELKGVDPHSLEKDNYKIIKLDADRNFFMEVMVSIYTEMILCKTFSSVQNYVNNIIIKENERALLFEDESKNRILQRELNKQLRQQRNHIKSVIYDTDATIDTLKTQLEDAPLNAEIRSRYVDNWQRARTEQHLRTITDNEATPSSIVEYYKQRMDAEQRVHSDVELLTNIRINETLAEVESWMDKYDRDMEALDLKIQIKKNAYQDMMDKRIDLELTIEKHANLITEWIDFKEAREKARQYRKKMTDSAVIIQAWWRGLLVRRQLGPFKVDKKKGAAARKK